MINSIIINSSRLKVRRIIGGTMHLKFCNIPTEHTGALVRDQSQDYFLNLHYIFDIFHNSTRWINTEAILRRPKYTWNEVQIASRESYASSSEQKTPCRCTSAPSTLDFAWVERLGVWSQCTSWPHIIFAPRARNYSCSGPSGLKSALVLLIQNYKNTTICASLTYTRSLMHLYNNTC